MEDLFILTGGTGFLGLRVSAYILRNGGNIIFLGRSKGGLSFGERVLRQLNDLDINYKVTQVESIEYDISDPINIDEIIQYCSGRKIKGVLHLAADLSFKKTNKKRVLRNNFEGTKKIAYVAEKLRIPIYYTSTAYVHGKRGGLVLEGELIEPKSFNNPYEESKFLAEKFLQKWSCDTGSKFVIFRPSILIDTDILPVKMSFGYYSVVLALINLKQLIIDFLNNKIVSTLFFSSRTSLNLSDEISVYFPFPNSKSCLLDLVPVQWVVEWMFGIIKDDSSINMTFHLCNPHPVPLKNVIRQTFDGIKMNMLIVDLSSMFFKLYFLIIRLLGSMSKGVFSLSQKVLPYSYYMSEYVLHDMKNTSRFVDNIDSYRLEDDVLFKISRKFLLKMCKSSN